MGRVALARGASLGRYLVIDEIGAGAMGTVYSAFDPELSRKVAVKVLHEAADGEDRQRLVREGQAIARLAHPNVVAVHDVGTQDGAVFMAMELVEGETVREWLATPRSWQEVRDVFAQAGRGLAAAHAAGLVHRDVKPANILVGADGRVRVGDFGLAREAGADDETGRAGTPAYMSPEQIRGRGSDARSDQFSFCVALHEALYGALPFDAGETTTRDGLGSTTSQALAVLSRPVREAPAGARVPAWLRRALLRGLNAAAEERYPSMDALLTDLHRDQRPGAGKWILLGAAVLAAGTATIVLVRPARQEPVCRGAGARWDGVWDPRRRAAVRTAIAGSRLPAADEIARIVETKLDRRVNQWTAMYTEACEATNVRRVQTAELLDLRAHCLERRLVETRTAVDLLAAGDPAQAARARDVVGGLEAIDGCADVPSLTARLPPPPGPDASARILALTARLAHARALFNAGQFDKGLEESHALEADARAFGHAPLLAEVLFNQGNLQQKRGKLKEAEQTLVEAARVADEGRDDLLRARAWNLAAFVVGNDLAKPDAGLAYANLARTALARHGGDPLLEAKLEHTLGNVIAWQGKGDGGLPHLRRAVELYEKAVGPDGFETAEGLVDLAANLPADRSAEAIELSQRALVIAERELGPSHPYVAKILNNLGASLYHLDRVDEALGYFEKSLASKEAALGKDHPSLAPSLLNLAELKRIGDDCAGAMPGYQRSIELWTAEGGVDNPRLAVPLTGLGTCLVDVGEPASAASHLERAMVLRDKAPPSPFGRGSTRFALARALWEQPKARTRALALAKSAADDFRAAGAGREGDVKLVEAWLADHR